MSRWIEPVTLEGRQVVLEPLRDAHVDDLTEATRDGELWRLWYTFVPAPDAVAEYVSAALARRDQHGEMPFAVRHRDSGKVIGSTRFCHVDEDNHRLEVGYTWYARRFQRSGLNTECKRLLLGHAFEALDAIAVEFRTHWHNRASRTAIARLGAKQDGILRNNRIMANGSYRDSAVYSIIASEWPSVKANLTWQLQQYA